MFSLPKWKSLDSFSFLPDELNTMMAVLEVLTVRSHSDENSCRRLRSFWSPAADREISTRSSAQNRWVMGISLRNAGSGQRFWSLRASERSKIKHLNSYVLLFIDGTCKENQLNSQREDHLLRKRRYWSWKFRGCRKSVVESQGKCAGLWLLPRLNRLKLDRHLVGHQFLSIIHSWFNVYTMYYIEKQSMGTLAPGDLLKLCIIYPNVRLQDLGEVCETAEEARSLMLNRDFWQAVVHSRTQQLP